MNYSVSCIVITSKLRRRIRASLAKAIYGNKRRYDCLLCRSQMLKGLQEAEKAEDLKELRCNQ